MHVTIKWFEGKYPSFNVGIASKEGQEPFLEVKGCKIMNGSDGEFVSWPSTKSDRTGKYWNHCYASKKFAAHVLEKAKEEQPKEAPKGKQEKRGSFDVMEDDIPF